MEERTYIAIDLKSFYASAECAARHLDALTARLVVADASRTDKTICLAVTPALKAYGVPGRPRLFEVKSILERVRERTGETVDFIIAPPRMSYYLEVSAEIYAIYLQYVSADDMHIYSVDEVFIDATDYLRLYRMDARTFTKQLVQAVYEQTKVTATAGIGTNLYLAKIAMDIGAKHCEPDQDGVRIAMLDEESYRRKLWAHEPITDFWRIGRGTARRLAANGMRTMGDVARRSLVDEESLYRIFGIDAELLIDHAWGIEPTRISDIKGYHAASNSISAGQVLSAPYDYDKTLLIVKEMTELLVAELVDKDLLTNSMTLDVGYDRENVDEARYDGEICIDRYGRMVPRPAHGSVALGVHTASTRLITERVCELFRRIAEPTLTVRRLNLTANNTIPRDTSAGEQMDLFTDYEALEKERKLQRAMLSVQKRYGKNAILKGMNLQEGATARDRNRQIGGHKA